MAELESLCQGIQDFVAQEAVKEASESAAALDSFAADDAVEHCIFPSAAEQAQGYPGYFVPVVRTRIRHPCWDRPELHALNLQTSTKRQQQQSQLGTHLHDDDTSDTSLKVFFWGHPSRNHHKVSFGDR